MHASTAHKLVTHNLHYFIAGAAQTNLPFSFLLSVYLFIGRASVKWYLLLSVIEKRNPKNLFLSTN